MLMQAVVYINSCQHSRSQLTSIIYMYIRTRRRAAILYAHVKMLSYAVISYLDAIMP